MRFSSIVGPPSTNDEGSQRLHAGFADDESRCLLAFFRFVACVSGAEIQLSLTLII